MYKMSRRDYYLLNLMIFDNFRKNKIKGTLIPKLAMVEQFRIYSKIRHINLSKKTSRNLQEPQGTKHFCQ